VGQEVDMGGGKVVKIKRVIAEGGYGYVFVAQDTQSGKEYALKRQVVAKDNIKTLKQEIAFLKQLRGHPHIIQLVGAAGSPPSHTSHGNAEFVILTELCSGGKMEDIVNSVRLSPRHVLCVFYQTCSAVAHLHSQTPPIIHRDLKVENLLLTTGGSIKLCDFGSATTEHVAPDHSWTATQRGLADDEIQQNTTPMYRSPEMIDLYSNHPICEKADIWALGCLLYKLCYREHPFEDSAKLRILSANYKLPSDDTTHLMFHSIIRACLQVNPADRPTVDSIVAQLYAMADKLRENLDQPSTELLTLTNSAPHTSNAPPTIIQEADQQTDEGNPSQVHAALHSTGQQAQKIFGFVKDGAGNLFKKLKDSSSTVVHQVANATQGSKRPSLDIAYITSRILAMSFPHEDSQHANSLWEVREFLETRHPSQYLVFNLSGHAYDMAQLNNQVADFAWPHKQMPDLEKLVDLCRNLDSWLRADKQNVIVLHCTDGRLVSALVVTAYLLFLNAFTSPLVPLKLFTFKRSLDIQIISPSPSQLRYLGYIMDLVGTKAYKPHSTGVTITAIQMSSVPLFNAIKTGCKPFVEVFQNGERVFTSASHDTMDQIQSFSSDSGGVLVPLGTKVRGNVQVIIHHIRAIPIGRKANLGMTAVRMFQFQFHTGFIPPSSNTLTLERQELDGIVAKNEGRFPSPFQVLLGLEWDQSGEPCSPGISWQNLPHPTSSPLPAFSSLLEQEEIMKQFCDMSVGSQLPNVAFYPHHHHQRQGGYPENQGNGGKPPQQTPEPAATSTTTAPPPPQSAKDFFSRLDWQAGESGYTAFAGESESDSDESSSSSEEEENQDQSPFVMTHTNHTPMVS
jgi:cyclin G-associated kinase